MPDQAPYVLFGEPGKAIANRFLRGWTELKIARRLDALVGTFQLSLSGSSLDAGRPPVPGSPIRILHGDEPVLTGFVDTWSSTDGDGTPTVTIAGRDLGADMVDSSTTIEPTERRNVYAVDVADALAAQFPLVEIELDPATRVYGTLIPLFRINPGETAWRALERALRLRNLLAWSDGLGRVVIGAAHGTAGTGIALGPPGTRAVRPLVWGDNLAEVEIGFSLAERFEVYVVKGQRAGSDLIFGGSAAQVAGRALDAQLAGRGRQLQIAAEQAIAPEDAAERAAWEASFRAARSATVVAKVPTWRQDRDDPGSPLWAVNQLARIQVPHRGLDRELLTAAVGFSYGPSGSETQVELVRLDAFIAAPEVDETENPFSDFLRDEEEEG